MVIVVVHETERTIIVFFSSQLQILRGKILASETDLRVHLLDPNDAIVEIHVSGQVINLTLGRRHFLHRREKDQRESSFRISVNRNRSGTPQPVERGRVDERIDDETGVWDETRHYSPEGPQERVNVTGLRCGILEPVGITVVDRRRDHNLVFEQRNGSSSWSALDSGSIPGDHLESTG